MDLFAGIPVTEFAAGRDWLVEDSPRAGHAVLALFVANLDRNEIGFGGAPE